MQHVSRKNVSSNENRRARVRANGGGSCNARLPNVRCCPKSLWRESESQTLTYTRTHTHMRTRVDVRASVANTLALCTLEEQEALMLLDLGVRDGRHSGRGDRRFDHRSLPIATAHRARTSFYGRLCEMHAIILRGSLVLIPATSFVLVCRLLCEIHQGQRTCQHPQQNVHGVKSARRADQSSGFKL